MIIANLKTDERCEVRLSTQDDWCPAFVRIASREGNALAVECEPGMGWLSHMPLGGAIGIHKETGGIVLLLSWDLMQQNYRDATTGLHFELRRKV